MDDNIASQYFRHPYITILLYSRYRPPVTTLRSNVVANASTGERIKRLLNGMKTTCIVVGTSKSSADPQRELKDPAELQQVDEICKDREIFHIPEVNLDDVGSIHSVIDQLLIEAGKKIATGAPSRQSCQPPITPSPSIHPSMSSSTSTSKPPSFPPPSQSTKPAAAAPPQGIKLGEKTTPPPQSGGCCG